MIIGSGDYRFELQEEWANVPEGSVMGDVCGIETASDDSVYLFTRGSCPMLHLSLEGKVLDKWESGYFTRIHGGRLSKDNSIFCVDADQHTVSKHKLDGTLIYCLGKRGVPNDTGFVMDWDLEAAIDKMTHSGPPFNYPTNLACTGDGSIYVSDGYGNGRIHHFSADGELIESFGDIGRGPGQFRLPHSIKQDRKGNFWVADRQNNRIQIFGPDMHYITEWDDFDLPCDLAIDEDGVVYVAELNRRLSVMDPDGKVIFRYRCDDEDMLKCVFVAPHGINIDSKKSIYIGDVCVTMGQVDRGGRSVRKLVKL